ncbi:general secretion pathway protein C [Desulfurobacterium pacificum]|uniref:General secretion pathway protein C n=1 Tax=Desulfurobacterium pacificum TaxID=240166 RepID=A0ABY1NCP3_9BACT|nr:PDZ domain-containing protein [Desulfurobacterium pacificum]SMP04496.1 general secretion pathway protein C [Desulfurobacterium pacificum]
MRTEKWTEFIVILPLIFLAFAISSFISSLFLFKLKPCLNITSVKLQQQRLELPIFTPLEKEGFFKSPSKNLKQTSASLPQKQTVTFNLDNYVLKGTIICSQCKHSIALLKDMKTGKTQPVTVGEEINGFKVKEIAPEYVIFSRDGKEIQLRLFKTKANQSSKISTVSPISSISKRTYTVKRSEIIKEISSGKFLRYINILPVEKPQSGLKVIYVNPRSFIYKLGIRPGDIIVSINNIAIRTPEDSFSAFEQLKSSDSVTITVYRNRKQVTLHYELE